MFSPVTRTGIESEMAGKAVLAQSKNDGAMLFSQRPPDAPDLMMDGAESSLF